MLGNEPSGRSQLKSRHALDTLTVRSFAEAEALQNSQESLRGIAKRYGTNQKTVAKWKRRETVADRSTGPKEAKSTVLSIAEEAIIVAFRRHTRLQKSNGSHELVKGRMSGCCSSNERILGINQ